jgi:hypothetical protein
LIVSKNKRAQFLVGKYPFLKNFPFNEFEIEVGELNSVGMVTTEAGPEMEAPSPTLIRFSINDKTRGRLSIIVFEREIEWISEVSDRVTNLDGIRKVLDRGIRSKDIISKRNAVESAEEWCKALRDNQTRLSYSTLGDDLTQMISSQSQLTQVVSKIVALSKKKGLVNLSQDEHDIIISHYHFQLIYTKLILGLVIATKISI